MTFQHRRIGRKSFRKTVSQKISHPLTVTVLSAAVVALFVIYGLWQVWANFNLSNVFGFVIGIFGENLQTDTQGNTNMLLLGTGGEGHEGENLTDSIMMVSINHARKTVNMISLPRDVYVQSGGGNRINKLYELALEKYKDADEGLDSVRNDVASLFDLSIPYAVKIDFQGFEQAVDELGGIDLTIPETIDDQMYPQDGTYGYEPFYIAAGNRHLDGKTALKYARSRKTSSDFDRGKRQQQILSAVREKAKQENVLSSPRRLRNLYDVIAPHVVTNMDLREMATLADLVKDISSTNIHSWNVHDDPGVTGGFLYTPMRDLYGGAFVLLPASDQWTSVKFFIHAITEKADMLLKRTPLQILNGTKTPGVAGNTKVILQRFGFAIARFGNGQNQNVKQTTLYIKSAAEPEIVKLLTQLIPAQISHEVPAIYLQPPYESDAEMILELGEDYLPTFDHLDIFRNVVSEEGLAEAAATATSTATPPKATK